METDYRDHLVKLQTALIEGRVDRETYERMRSDILQTSPSLKISTQEGSSECASLPAMSKASDDNKTSAASAPNLPKIQIRCPECHSSGKCSTCCGNAIFSFLTCDDCDGTRRCWVCGGSGETTRTPKLIACHRCETLLSDELKDCTHCGQSFTEECGLCSSTGTCYNCQGKGAISLGLLFRLACNPCAGSGKCRKCHGFGAVRRKPV